MAVRVRSRKKTSGSWLSLVFAALLAVSLSFLIKKWVKSKTIWNEFIYAAHRIEQAPTMVRGENANGQTHMIDMGGGGIGMIDIISVGSLSRMDLINAQKATFGRPKQKIYPLSIHKGNATSPGSFWQVRQFHTTNEDDDSETQCHSNLTKEQVMQISKHCRSAEVAAFSWKMRHLAYGFFDQKFLATKGEAVVGWTCAIKRPPESLANALQRYQASHLDFRSSLPDYLMLIDDDTYLNLPAMLKELEVSYPPYHSYAVAGCMFGLKHTIGWGGFGTFFTRHLLERFIHPLNCMGNSMNHNNTHLAIQQEQDPSLSEFETLVCQRIHENLIGEGKVFRQGMTLADLLLAYVTQWNYTSVNQWDQNPPGLCLHADWIVGYWINAFYLSRPSFATKGGISRASEDRLHPYMGSYLNAPGKFSQCKNGENGRCLKDAHICHHTTAQKMHEMYELHNIFNT